MLFSRALGPLLLFAGADALQPQIIGLLQCMGYSREMLVSRRGRGKGGGAQHVVCIHISLSGKGNSAAGTQACARTCPGYVLALCAAF